MATNHDTNLVRNETGWCGSPFLNPCPAQHREKGRSRSASACACAWRGGRIVTARPTSRTRGGSPLPCATGRLWRIRQGGEIVGEGRIGWEEEGGRPSLSYFSFSINREQSAKQGCLFLGSSTSRNNPTNQPPVQERNSNRGANQEESRTLTAISIERGGGFGRREGT